ncbi:MAG TPA: S41 family peptidase [Lachnospiraceae bacterium]|jgi:carboxyl-terminal processing protease|nr:S41 family peptidase [Lachnospiraceae bacterium]HBY72655.1 S41 family peptidase [Lachnospiraceae bacterium]
MKKNFTTGLLSGVCCSILLFAIIGTLYVMADGKANENDRNNNVRLEAEENGQATLKNEDFDQIVDKLTFLEMLVDNYYLEGVDPKVYADGIYKGFISSLNDPYSTYYTAEEYKALMESSSGVYRGIGATVSQNVKTGVITIVKPFKTGPAYEAGLLPGDIIYMVEGEEATGVDLTEVVSKMKGEEGTKVRISILREGETKPMEFTITRRQIEVPTIDYQMLEDNIGYIEISEFDEITVSQFKEAVDKLEAKGMKGLVVDVRNNPGGLLEAVCKMLDRLLPKGLLVYTEDKYGNRVEEKAEDSQMLKVPLAVIINGNSASASEIFAGAVQDYGIGTIVGTTSFGKGIVQKVIPLTDGTAVKLTISKYFTPKGRNIHGTGITPDVEVELNEELLKEIEIPQKKDNQLQKAIEVVKEKIK